MDFAELNVFQKVSLDHSKLMCRSPPQHKAAAIEKRSLKILPFEQQLALPRTALLRLLLVPFSLFYYNVKLYSTVHSLNKFIEFYWTLFCIASAT